jgi:isocitrate/isopropylmalate dehydrogenase
MSKSIPATLISGDGIGPEIVDAAVQVSRRRRRRFAGRFSGAVVSARTAADARQVEGSLQLLACVICWLLEPRRPSPI